MIQTTVLFLALCAGTLVEPFRIAQAEPGHHQTYPCAAMAPDGHFAVAWVDSIASGDPFNPENLELDLFIRFFNRDGNPMTDAYRIAKMADTNWIHYPWLEMDTAGNAVLLWVDRVTQSAEQPSYVRFQRFAPDGSPACSAHTVVARIFLYKRSPIDLSLNNRGEFAVTWLEVIPPYWELTCVWVQRFDLEGYPEDRAFLPHDIPGNYLLPFSSPRVALNDEGDLVVTWRDQPNPDTVYRRFQVFDAADEPVLSWRPRGHLLDYGKWGKYAEPYWLDNDRFVAFWTYGGLVGGVFGHRGLTRYPIRTVVVDEKAIKWYATVERSFFVAFSSDERFAETHGRSYHHLDPWCVWDHGGGVLGEIRDNEPWRQTNLFEYTLPFEKDTAQGINPVWMAYFVPAVGVCDDRIVWVYPHSTPDSLCEAWVLISDWDMGVGVAESPVQTESPIQLSSSLNRLSYDVSGSVTGEAKLTLYSADGRKVLEETIEGKGVWDAPLLPQGVYFARVEGDASSKTQKVVLIR